MIRKPHRFWLTECVNEPPEDPVPVKPLTVWWLMPPVSDSIQPLWLSW
jgi:hypothetical protein